MVLDTIREKKWFHSPRVNACYPVLVLTADGPVRGETKHISAKEAFVRCSDPLRLYDIASLSIEVSEQESLVAEAEVVWSNRYGPDDEITPRGMMVRFTSLSKRDRHRLHNAIVTHYQKKASRKPDR